MHQHVLGDRISAPLGFLLFCLFFTGVSWFGVGGLMELSSAGTACLPSTGSRKARRWKMLIQAP